MSFSAFQPFNALRPFRTSIGLNKLAALIKTLFGNDEAGGMWLVEPKYCWQDVNRTIPCTAPGDLVALNDDVSQGLTLGPELATGAPNVGASWTDNGDGSFTGTATDGSDLYWSTGLAANKQAVISFTISGWTSGSLQIIAFGGTGLASASGNGNKSLSRLVGNGNIGFNNALSGVTVSNMSIRELKGNHAIQETEASRPALQQTAEGLWYLAFDGVDDWLLLPNWMDIAVAKDVAFALGMRKGGSDGMLGTHSGRDSTYTAIWQDDSSSSTGPGSGYDAGTFSYLSVNGEAVADTRDAFDTALGVDNCIVQTGYAGLQIAAGTEFNLGNPGGAGASFSFKDRCFGIITRIGHPSERQKADR